MVKGINKRIVEVNVTENEVFEKAILFVRNESVSEDDAHLNREAKDYLDDIAGEYRSSALRDAGDERRSSRIIYGLLKYSAAAIAGATFACAFFQF